MDARAHPCLPAHKEASMSGHKIGWFLKILFSYLLLTGILIACVGLPVI